MSLPKTIDDVRTAFPASTLTGTEVIPLSQSGVTKGALASQLATLFSGVSTSFLASGTGAVARTPNSKMGDIVSVKDFGAKGDGVTDDTAAFNAAIAASRIVYVPTGTYLLSALNNISGAANFHMYGDGITSVLKFNTTGKAIQLGPFATPTQNRLVHIHDLQFTNVTNTPSAFISQENYVNSVFERLHFPQNTAATYCIDNVSGYGTTIRDCVFFFIVGTPIRLRDNGAAPNYSYVATIDHCDITSPTSNGIEIEGNAVGTLISNCAIEGCGGKGIVTSTGGSVNTLLDIVNCDFESNTGTDIDLGTNGGTYWGRAVIRTCSFAGTPSIALGSKSKVIFIGFQSAGITVSGSANAEAILIGCEPASFTQSGTFPWTVLGCTGVEPNRFPGTVTNDNAATGYIGEYVSQTIATASSVSLTSPNTSNVAQITLTAGDWDVTGVIDFTFGAATSYTNLTGGISTTSATLGAQDSGFDYETPATVPTAGKDQAWVVPTIRLSLSGSTTVFLVAQGVFTVSTLKAYGTISARRAR